MAKQSEKVTTLREMKESSHPVVQIPGWEDGQDINVRLQRVSFLQLIEKGELPNELLLLVHKIAIKGTGELNPYKEGTSLEDIQNFARLLQSIAQIALIEPTYEKIQEEAGGLTDGQLTAIFFFCNGGIRALNSFRQRSEVVEAPGGSGQDIQLPAE